MDYRSVLEEVESWPVDDRLRLVFEVWDRLEEADAGGPIDADLAAELDRRIEAMDRNPGEGLPWEAVKARIPSTHGR